MLAHNRPEECFQSGGRTRVPQKYCETGRKARDSLRLTTQSGSLERAYSSPSRIYAVDSKPSSDDTQNEPRCLEAQPEIGERLESTQTICRAPKCDLCRIWAGWLTSSAVTTVEKRFRIEAAPKMKLFRHNMPYGSSAYSDHMFSSHAVLRNHHPSQPLLSTTILLFICG